MQPPGGRYLQLYAADLGRGPDGRWWVLGDRAQAPSGAGYALENRLALVARLPDLYSAMNVAAAGAASSTTSATALAARPAAAIRASAC